LRGQPTHTVRLGALLIVAGSWRDAVGGPQQEAVIVAGEVTLDPDFAVILVV